MSSLPTLPFISRQALARVFTDPNTLYQMEEYFRYISELTPQAIDATIAGVSAIEATRPIVVGTADLSVFPSARVLKAGAGATIDEATTSVAKIVVNIGTEVQAWSAILDTLASTYSANTWTPAVTFSTPGNLAVAYGSRAGYYIRVGSIVIALFSVAFTPTYTTASGTLRVTGLPLAVDTTYPILGAATHTDALTYPAGVTNIAWQAVSASLLELWGYGTGVSGVSSSTKRIGVTQAPSATAQSLSGVIVYKG